MTKKKSGKPIILSVLLGICLLSAINVNAAQQTVNIQKHNCPNIVRIKSLPSKCKNTSAAAAWSPDSKLLATFSYDSFISINDPSGASITAKQIDDQADSAFQKYISWFPDSSGFFTLSENGYLRRFKKNGDCIAIQQIAVRAGGCAVSPTGKYIAVLSKTDTANLYQLIIYDISTSKIIITSHKNIRSFDRWINDAEVYAHVDTAKNSSQSGIPALISLPNDQARTMAPKTSASTDLSNVNTSSPVDNTPDHIVTYFSPARTRVSISVDNEADELVIKLYSSINNNEPSWSYTLPKRHLLLSQNTKDFPDECWSPDGKHLLVHGFVKHMIGSEEHYENYFWILNLDN